MNISKKCKIFNPVLHTLTIISYDLLNRRNMILLVNVLIDRWIQNITIITNNKKKSLNLQMDFKL